MSTMNVLSSKFRNKQGFTVIELIVIIVVIAILALVAVLGYGAWRESTAIKAVQSDLKTVEGAMNNSNNFEEDGFPSSIPGSFQSGDNVDVTYISGDSKTYCIEARSKIIDTIVWHVAGKVGESTIAEGECAFTDGWKEIAAVDDSTCALSVGNKIYCWGSGTNTPTELGAGAIPANATLSDIAGGSSHFCVVADGWVYCWGANNNGRLGDGTSTARVTPVAIQRNVIPTGQALTDVAAGGNHTCAKSEANLVYCWGYGLYGALGRNSTSSSSVPVAVVTTNLPGGVTAKDISAGGSNTCMLGSNDWVYCWGSGSNGENGDNSTSQRNLPVAVSRGAIPVGATISDFSVGGNHSCVISNANVLYCWGSGTSGRLGQGTNNDSTTPVAAYQPSLTFSKIGAGTSSSCAITVSGVGYCWGYNAQGQLAINNTSTWYIPIVTVNGAKPNSVQYSQIKVGSTHACGIGSDGSIYCWGKGDQGALGNGANSNSLIPVKAGDVPTP